MTTTVPTGKRVFIYWNLHKNCFSVRSREGADRGRVIAHVTEFAVTDAAFKVSKAGHARVIAEQRKNVHAGIAGIWTDEQPARSGEGITYNPYIAAHFRVRSTDQPIRFADSCIGRIVDGRASLTV